MTFKVNVVESKLQVLLHGEPVDRVQFGSTYYGCDVIQSYLLYNDSPAKTHFVVILDEGSEGEELVRKLYIPFVLMLPISKQTLLNFFVGWVRGYDLSSNL